MGTGAELTPAGADRVQPQSTPQAVAEDRQYIYCITDSEEEKTLGPVGIGDRDDPVQMVCYRDIAAVVSPSPLEKYSISREHTMAHQHVMETVMGEHTVLPVRFGTVAKSRNGVGVRERIRAEVLEQRYEELKGLLLEMKDKTELGLKALWIQMDKIFQEIVEESGQIKRLKERIAAGHESLGHGDRLALGEMVKEALDAKRIKEETAILSVLKGAYVEHRRNKIMGDRMITNSAFLVETDRTGAFDELVNWLSQTSEGRMHLKYVGPVPPCNFVELVIALEGER